MRTRRHSVTLISLAVVAILPAAVVTPGAAERFVDPSALEKLLPAPEGWTKGDVRSNRFDLAECAYTSAAVWYTKGDMRVKVTLADTGSQPESLMALASMVVTLPEGYADQIEPATTIKRIKVDGGQAVEMWDADKTNGEITVVVGGRFVATVEASKADSLDTLRAIVAAVDLKRLGSLK